MVQLHVRKWRLNSNIKCKSSINTYLNIIKLLFFNIIFFQFKDHRIGKFSNNIDFRKLDFLSEEKISERYRFVNKDVMQFLNILNLFNILMILNKF